MAKNYNFKATLGLETKGFQKGVKMVQASLNSLKMKFMSFGATLGAGLGLSNIGKTLIETAKQMDKSQTTLKNVSESFKEYTENQKFLMEMSNKYNQDILVLTDNFSKFHSSSNQANVSLQDQRDIFQSLTRASAFFNLTADETNGIFLAVTQMMSKGKVQSEELRRQLGERLPGAFEIMAKAIGVSAAELDKLLREGKVTAADALPKFARALNDITQNINVDTIQGWSNRFKNAITNLTKNLSINNMYRDFMRGSTKAVEFIGRNFDKLKKSIIALGTAMVSIWTGNKITQAHKNYIAGIKRDLHNATKERSRLEARFNRSQYKDMFFQNGEHNYRFKGWSTIMKEHPDKINEIKKMAQNPPKGLRDAEIMAGNIAKQSGIISKNFKLSHSWFARLVDVGKNFLGLLRSIMSTFVVTAIIAGLSMIIQKFIEMNREAKQAKGYMKETMDAFNKQSKEISSEDTPLTVLRDDIKENYGKSTDGKSQEDINEIMKERGNLIAAINRELGLSEDSYFDEKSSLEDILDYLNREIKLREKLRQLQAAKDFQAQTINDRQIANDIIADLKKQIAEKDKTLNDPSSGLSAKAVAKVKKKDLERQLANQQTIVNGANDIIKKTAEKIGEYSKDISELEAKKGQATRKEQPEPPSEYDELKGKYENQLAILNSKLRDEILTQEEYNNALKNLVNSTLDGAYELAQSNKATKVGGDAFSKALLEKARELKKIDTTPIQKVEKEFKDARTELRNKLNGGALDSKGFEEAMSGLVEETFNTLAGMGALSGELTEFAKFIKDLHNRFKNKSKKDLEYEFKQDMPKLEKRDTTFDYSKSDSDIKYEQAEIWQNQVEELQRKMDEIKNDSNLDGMFDDVNKQLTEAIKNAKDFKTAADLSKIKEDVKDLRKSAFSSVSDGVDSIATVIDRLTDDMEKLNNPEVEGWERIQIILNSIFQTFDGIIKAVEMFTELEKIMNQLTAAEKAQQAVEAAGTATSLAGSASKVAAGQAEALSNGTASASKLPFPANLAAIAASIAAITAIFATFPKFSAGGIFSSGSKTGDHMLARLNDGEMVLNSFQQKRLFDMLNGKGVGGGNVQFEIKGDRLVGVLKNYTKKVSK